MGSAAGGRRVDMDGYPKLNGAAFSASPVTHSLRVAEAALIAPPKTRSQAEALEIYEVLKARFCKSLPAEERLKATRHDTLFNNYIRKVFKTRHKMWTYLYTGEMPSEDSYR